jgi:hypothetical protein
VCLQYGLPNNHPLKVARAIPNQPYVLITQEFSLQDFGEQAGQQHNGPGQPDRERGRSGFCLYVFGWLAGQNHVEQQAHPGQDQQDRSQDRPIESQQEDGSHHRQDDAADQGGTRLSG